MRSCDTSPRACAPTFAEGGRLVVVADESEVVTTDLLDARALVVAGGSTGLIALDPFTDTDALAALSSDAPASCELGRELLAIGDFEDHDVDDGHLEPGLWIESSHRYLQGSQTFAGTGAAVLLRRSTNSGRTSLWMDKRVPITPGGAMTITGWHKGVNAGEFRVTVRWMDDDGDTITHTTQYQNFEGDFDWSRFSIDVTAPANAAYLQVYFRHYPPHSSGEGQLLLDEVDLVAWDPSPVAVDGAGVDIATPNAWDVGDPPQSPRMMSYSSMMTPLTFLK